MGCGSSLNQVYNSTYPISSTKPFKLEQVFQSQQPHTVMRNLFMFGQNQTKRRIIQLSISQIDQSITLKHVQTRHHIPRPKVYKSAIQLLYEEAQQVFPANLHNTTSLPPYNLMLVLMIKSKIFFLCGGTDFEFWNVNSQSFLYRIATNIPQSDITQNSQPTKKNQKDGPQSEMLQFPQKTLDRKKMYNKFQRLPYMNQGRYSHMGIAVERNKANFVYVFGGYGHTKEALCTCEKYRFDKNQWQSIAPMKFKRATGFCFEFLDKIYVFGGFTSDQKRTKKIEVLQLDSQQWTTLDVKLHQGIEQGFLSSFNPNQILVMGGNIQGGNIKSIIKVNIIKETYQWDCDLIHSDSLQKGTQIDGKAYIFGSQKPYKCQVYDSAKSQVFQTEIRGQGDTIKIAQLSLYSGLFKSIKVAFESIDKKKQKSNKSQQFQSAEEKLLLFGTDSYPLLLASGENEKQLSAFPVPMKLRLRKHMGICRISQTQYVLFGGIDSFSNNPTKAAFLCSTNSATSPFKQKIQQIDKMPNKIYKPGMCLTKQYLYVIGGCTQNQKKEQIESSQCFRLNLQTHKWKHISQLNYRRSECQVVQVPQTDESIGKSPNSSKSKITQLLVFGGYCNGQWVDKVEYFEIEESSTHQQKSKQQFEYFSRKQQFVILRQKVPLFFPVFSKAMAVSASIINAKREQSQKLSQKQLSQSQSQAFQPSQTKQVKLFILNRNIHLNKFQEIYLTLNLSDTIEIQKGHDLDKEQENLKKASTCQIKAKQQKYSSIANIGSLRVIEGQIKEVLKYKQSIEESKVQKIKEKESQQNYQAQKHRKHETIQAEAGSDRPQQQYQPRRTNRQNCSVQKSDQNISDAEANNNNNGNGNDVVEDYESSQIRQQKNNENQQNNKINAFKISDTNANTTTNNHHPSPVATTVIKIQQRVETQQQPQNNKEESDNLSIYADCHQQNKNMGQPHSTAIVAAPVFASIQTRKAIDKLSQKQMGNNFNDWLLVKETWQGVLGENHHKDGNNIQNDKNSKSKNDSTNKDKIDEINQPQSQTHSQSQGLCGRVMFINNSGQIQCRLKKTLKKENPLSTLLSSSSGKEIHNDDYIIQIEIKARQDNIKNTNTIKAFQPSTSSTDNINSKKAAKLFDISKLRQNYA